MAAPTSQTNKLPPSPSEQGILKEDQKSLISLPWIQWFISLSAKINTINTNNVEWSKVSVNNGTPGTYGDATHYPIITTNVNGLVTKVTVQAVSSGGGNATYVNQQTGTSYTLLSTDIPSASSYKGMVTMQNSVPNTLTIPPNSSAAFPIGAELSLIELGTGQTTIAAGTGVTIIGPTITGIGQYSSGKLIQLILDTWYISGNLPYISAGADLYWAYVVLLLVFNGAAGSTSFPDSSKLSATVTPFGSAKITTSISLYGGSSASFDGSTGYLTTPYVAADYDWWPGDYTLELWVYAANFTGWSYVDGFSKSTCIGNAAPASATNYWSFGPTASGTVTFAYYNGSPQSIVTTASVSLTTWTHLALVKTSSGIQIFVNGVGNTVTAVVGTPQSSTGVPLSIGKVATTLINGNLYDLRITKIARYTANFTPPSGPFPTY